MFVYATPRTCEDDVAAPIRVRDRVYSRGLPRSALPAGTRSGGRVRALQFEGMRTLAVLATLAAGCGAAAHPAERAPVGGDEITLYRDRAYVRQRVELDVPSPTATVSVPIAAGVDEDSVTIVDPGGLIIDHPRVRRADARPDADRPAELALDVTAPHAGHFPVEIAYLTDRVRWDVGYTLVTTPAHDRATLAGAVSIRNTTGLRLHGTASLVDAELGTAKAELAQRVGDALRGGEHHAQPAVEPCAIGDVDLGPETRVALPGLGAPRVLTSMLVYDPIGATLDNPSAVPARDLDLGIKPPATGRVTENLEVARDPRVHDLPAGPVRLFERRADGTLAQLGDGKLFGPADRAAKFDTIPIGTARGVTGHRTRKEITIDDDRHRLTEEFQIAIDNTRPQPVHVLVREHLYRGQNWTLAYNSAMSAAKEGAQQIALRTDVPARAHAKIVYVVVYTWDL